MKRDDLGNLLRLRRQREQKAIGVVAVRQHQLRHAETELEAANEAVTDHERQSRDQERKRLASLIGQELRAGQIASLQSGLNAEADRHRDLARGLRQAESNHQARQTELQAAQTEFRKRHRQAEKLSLLQAEVKAKGSRRSLAITEVEAEELQGVTPTGGPSAIRGEE
jgi:chromosome segregation ATPase